MDTHWYTNLALWSSLLSWLAAQVIKIAADCIQGQRFDFTKLVSTGGMPSAHSALVSGLAVSVGISEGFGSTLFAVTAVFAGVVMFDAQSVRRAAGEQAQLLNQLVDEFFKEHHLSETKLAELLGHTRLEVFFGMTTGILCASALHFLFH